MNDPKKLHDEFVRLGSLRHKLKNKMLAILPEIYDSGIWKKYAGSIVEYAGKYGDIAKTTVIKRLRLEENLDGLPFLKAVIEKVGVHKVAMVAKIATPENDEKLAESILNMSKLAVQNLSKEMRAGQDEVSSQPGFDNCGHVQDQLPSGGQLLTHQLSPCKAIPVIKKIELDEESTFLFLKLKAKLGKKTSDKEFLKLILEEREKREFPQVQDKARKEAALPKVAKCSGTTKDVSKAGTKSVTGDSFYAKSIMADENPNVTAVPASGVGDTFAINTSSVKTTTSRHIPVDKKRTAIAQTNGKCAYPNCNKPYEVIHHTDRYSESRSHDSITPLCKIHHEFAHNGFIENETAISEKWQMTTIKQPTTKISQADILYKKCRQEAMN